jgi:hypothetical protein
MRILDRRQQVIGQILAFGDEEGVFLGQAAGRAARVRIIGGAAVSRGVGRGFEGAREALEVCGEDFGEQAIEIRDIQIPSASAIMVRFRRPRAAKVLTAALRMRSRVRWAAGVGSGRRPGMSCTTARTRRAGMFMGVY